MQAAVINAQQLARTPEALPLLLALLEQGPGGVGDFYARYHALQVIRGLAAMAPRQLQEVGAGGCCPAGAAGMSAGAVGWDAVVGRHLGVEGLLVALQGLTWQAGTAAALLARLHYPLRLWPPRRAAIAPARLARPAGRPSWAPRWA